MRSTLSQTLMYGIIGTYVLSLVIVCGFFYEMALPPLWIVFGCCEVVFFCGLTYLFSQIWENYSYLRFEQSAFLVALIVRVLYVIFSYHFYSYMNEQPFEFHAADSLFYHGVACDVFQYIENVDWNIFSYIRSQGLPFSDSGYPFYLSCIYVISDNSILFTRLLKALWSALTVVLIYKISYRNFGEEIAKLTATFCVFYPNLILYCGLHLKEVEMLFVLFLFIERADMLLQERHFVFIRVALVALLLLIIYSFRTALGIVASFAFVLTFIFHQDLMLRGQRRVVVILLFLFFAALALIKNPMVNEEVTSLFQQNITTQQQQNMAWRSNNKGGNKLAKYASASVFAPLIFTIPFATLVDIPEQENQKLINGGNFLKNVLSFFAIGSILFMFVRGQWRKHVLLLNVYGGYLCVLVFSSFAHSERFHLPIIPLMLLFVSCGLVRGDSVQQRRWFAVWCFFMTVCLVGWNWFKLHGRGYV